MTKRHLLMAWVGFGLVTSLQAATPSTADTDDTAKTMSTDNKVDDKDDTIKDAVKPVIDTENRGTSKQVSRLATEFNVSKAEITNLRNEGLGWGEIRNALAIAQKANVPVDTVVKQHQSGTGWGQIAKQYGFKLGDVTGKGRMGIDRDRGKEPDLDNRENRGSPAGGHEPSGAAAEMRHGDHEHEGGPRH